jgi:hypothetical protein
MEPTAVTTRRAARPSHRSVPAHGEHDPRRRNAPLEPLVVAIPGWLSRLPRALSDQIYPEVPSIKGLFRVV